MDDVIVTRRKYHIVRSLPGCTVRQEGANGTVIETTVPADEDTPVFAHSGRWSIEGDENVTVTEVFKLAPQQKLAILGVLGGNAGNNGGLPAGYKRVEWLENPYTESQTNLYFAYFSLGILTRTQADTVKIATMHRLTKIPTEIRIEMEGSIRSNGDVILGQAKQGRPASADPVDAPATIFNTMYGGFDSADNSLNYNLFKAKQGWDTEWHEQSLYIDAYKVIYTDNAYEQIHQIVGAPVNYADSPMYCFGYEYHSGLYPGCSRRGQKKWFKVWKNDILLFDLVPALDPTGAPCMFDLVSRKPFYNAGVGDFLYPGKEEESVTYSLRRPITYAQLTEHGVRRLYKVPKGYNGTKAEYAMEHGFKPLVETLRPEQGYWVPQWRETAEEIVLDWVETEPPMDEPLTNN